MKISLSPRVVALALLVVVGIACGSDQQSESTSQTSEALGGDGGAVRATHPALRSLAAAATIAALRQRCAAPGAALSDGGLASRDGAADDGGASVEGDAGAAAPLVSSLPVGEADAFEENTKALNAQFASKKGSAVHARASFPTRSVGQVDLTDAATNMHVRIALIGAHDAPAETADGYVVYRGAADGGGRPHRRDPRRLRGLRLLRARAAVRKCGVRRRTR